MNWSDLFLFLFNFVINSLKSVFQPPPDMRYKLQLNGCLISNEMNPEILMSSPLSNEYEVELAIAEKIYRPFVFLNKRGQRYITGIPIVAPEDMSLSIISILDDEVVWSGKFKRGSALGLTDPFLVDSVFAHD